MTERKEGWYWVKVYHNGKWGCFFWTGTGWRDTSGVYGEALFAVVGPRIQTPDEPFKCVPVEPTAEMVDAASEAYMPFGDMALAIQAAIVYAPEEQQ